MAAGAHVVVVRYDEPLDWLAGLGAAQLWLYNKGEPDVQLPLGAADRVSQLRVPNRGREGEAYLRHIIEQYDSLPDIVIFTQARITDHLAAWTTVGTSSRWRGRRFASETAFLQCLAAQAESGGLSEPTEAVSADTKDHNWRSDWNRDYLGTVGSWFMPDRYLEGNVTFREWFERWIGPYPFKARHESRGGLFCACSCGIFAVRRDRILSRSRSYYEALHRQVAWHVDPVEGHFLERSWFYIFGGGCDDGSVMSMDGPSTQISALPLHAAPPIGTESIPVVFSSFGVASLAQLETVVRVAASQHRVVLLGDRTSVRLATLPNVEFVDATGFRASVQGLLQHYLAASPAPTKAEWFAFERVFLVGRYLDQLTHSLGPPRESAQTPPVERDSSDFVSDDSPALSELPTTPVPTSPLRVLLLDEGCVLLRQLSSMRLSDDSPHASRELAAALCDAHFCARLESEFKAAARIDGEWLQRTLASMGTSDLAVSASARRASTDAALPAVFLLNGFCGSSGVLSPNATPCTEFEREDGGPFVRFQMHEGRNLARDIHGNNVEPVCVRFAWPQARSSSPIVDPPPRRISNGSIKTTVHSTSSHSAALPPSLSLQWLKERLILPPLLLERSKEVAMRSQHNTTHEQGSS
eukprot:scaffold102777_cov30-Tisochrysis_lutea.AAC.1